jgi:DNA modification methylase
MEALCSNLDRLCTESAHIMFWFSMHHYQKTIDYFHKHSDFRLDPFPLFWHKSDNKGLLPDPQRGPRRIYETCLFGSRGDRLIVTAKANACSKPTDGEQHISTKPEPVLRHFFEMFVDESTNMLDPTCGSGTALRAAEGLGAQHVLGLEINPEFAEDAQLSLGAARRVIKSRAAVL